jgi:hypothetical protein
MALGKVELHIAATDEEDPECPEDDIVAYVSLPGHPGRGTAGVVAKQVRLRDLVGDHGGVDVFLDFDREGVLIGFEILC